MVYQTRRTLKSRRTYGRGSRPYRQTVYRRAYFNSRRGVGRKERKGCDINFASTQVVNSTNTNANIYLLNGIQEGVGSWNRIGRYIWNKSIELDLNLSWNASYSTGDTAIHTASWIRCMVIWDKQPNNGSIPALNEIIGHTDQTGAESSTTSDHLRYDNMFRFKVLLDETINPTMVNSIPGLASAPTADGMLTTAFVRWHKYLKLGNKMTNFSGTADPVTTANISTGALYLILRAPNSDPDDYWGIESTSTARLRYVD